jgi:fatty-acyl-CoA synthase
MAALVTGAGFDLAGLRRALQERLPAYARPLFLRIVAAIELTGTFKLRTHELALEGYDLTRVRDIVYMEDSERDEYIRLDARLHEQLQAGRLPL